MKLFARCRRSVVEKKERLVKESYRDNVSFMTIVVSSLYRALLSAGVSCELASAASEVANFERHHYGVASIIRRFRPAPGDGVQQAVVVSSLYRALLSVGVPEELAWDAAKVPSR
jgi:hypothetical protein